MPTISPADILDNTRLDKQPDTQLDKLLQQRFGFEAFRPGQREAIEALLYTGRLLCIQPTGHGKSLLYQLPTLMLDGITLVISPLLALVRDQLDHLQQRFNIPAAAINSDQSDEENAAARRAAVNGDIKLLFVAPEQLDNIERFEFLLALPVSLVVVDEAHCISTWGHDFRPAYRLIVRLVQALAQQRPKLRVLGLTATADARVEADIKSQLGCGLAGELEGESGRELLVHRESMDRANLHLAVVPVTGMAYKLAYLQLLLPQLRGEGIIYCATRENTETVAGFLRDQGLNVAAYHAGLDADEKRTLQQDFIHGRYQAIAATNALGMGIDKADLRYVIHVDVPGSITAYYQEVGRGGRDGLPARGIVLFDPADRRIQSHFINSAQPAPGDFDAVLSVVRDAEADTERGPANLATIKARTGLHPTRVTVVVAELVEQGFLQKRSSSGRQVYVSVPKNEAPNLTRYENQLSVRNRELEAMMSYGEGETDCLMATLRRALGDADVIACGHCSRCVDATSSVKPDGAAVAVAQSWLGERPVIIPGSRLNGGYSAGQAVLDGGQRSAMFLRFMQQRATAAALAEDLLELMRVRLRGLAADTAIGSVVRIPSRTWTQREATAAAVGECLSVPVFTDLLAWNELPPVRQGELLNNDQRKENVRGKMRCNRRVGIPPPGAILLLDDYSGSSATLQETVRALRKQGRIDNPIIPFTIARIRWRLGTRGMV